ncbi:MAG: hypothetical protein ACI4QY_06780 [Oscillospiraceae bacterium]
MNEVLKEYRRIHRITLIGNWAVTALCVPGLALVGTFSRRPFFAVMVTAALVLLSLFYTVEFIAEPLIFKRKIAKAGLALDEKPAKFPMRFFFGNTVVFFANWKIKFADCGEIIAAEMRRSKIRLTFKDGGTLDMPFRAGENPALLCAVLRTLNGNIDFVINGKHINKGHN